MADHSWIESMQDELNQFERLQVWELILRPEGKNVIALKWLWKKKCDAENIVVRNKTVLWAKRIHAGEGMIWKVLTDLCAQTYGGDILLVQVYVDDIIFGLTNPDFSKRFANLMKNNFEMSMLGKPKLFLGTHVQQSPCRPTVNTSKRLGGPMQDVKMIVKAHQQIAFLGGKARELELKEKRLYCDVMLRLNMFLVACLGTVIWIRTQLLDYGYKYYWIPMYCDSKSTIAISCNPVQHSKTKHIDITGFLSTVIFIKEITCEKGLLWNFTLSGQDTNLRIYLLKLFQRTFEF
ncbi:retrovirus-related pol polyprotein from transposon TNT 1-94 [Tanacetum coccineum]